MEENMIVIEDPKTFILILIGLKDADKILKHEMEFIIKSNEYLADNKIKDKIEQLLSEYKHENNSHEHGNQQNE